jgi:hypothetical protein
VTTYSGFDGESKLLWHLFKQVVSKDEHPEGQGERLHPDLPIYANHAGSERQPVAPSEHHQPRPAIRWRRRWHQRHAVENLGGGFGGDSTAATGLEMSDLAKLAKLRELARMLENYGFLKGKNGGGEWSRTTDAADMSRVL